MPTKSTPSERDESDRNAPLGEATTRFEDRVMCSLGKGGHAQPEFSSEQALCGAGVLFLLPALISQGLLKTKEVYQFPASHYYGVESVVMTLAFMALSRIKNPEQLKLCKPGEIGRLIGLDRIPEMKCLREKIKLSSEQMLLLTPQSYSFWYSSDLHFENVYLLYESICMAY